MKAIADGDTQKVTTIIKQSPIPHSKPESYSDRTSDEVTSKIIFSLIFAGIPCCFPSLYEGRRTTTPLILAIQENQPEIANMLINSGVNIKVQDNNQLTALEQAAKMEDEYMTKTLLSRGAGMRSHFCSEAKNFLDNIELSKKNKEEEEKKQKMEREFQAIQALTLQQQQQQEREYLDQQEKEKKEQEKQQKMKQLLNSL